MKVPTSLPKCRSYRFYKVAVLGGLTFAAFLLYKECGSTQHPKRSSPTLLDSSKDAGKPRGFSISSGLDAGKILMVDKIPMPALAPPENTIKMEQQTKYLQTLPNLVSESTYTLEGVKLVPSKDEITAGSDSFSCMQVMAGGKSQGFIKFWLPQHMLNDLKNGDSPLSYGEMFPMQPYNLYYGVTLLKDGDLVGKQTSSYNPDLNLWLENIVWNDGREEWFWRDVKASHEVDDDLSKDSGGLYPVDKTGNLLSQDPTWTWEETTAYVDDEPAQLEIITPVAAPLVQLLIDSNDYKDSRFFIRLQDSCDAGSRMLPTFLEIRNDNFRSFIDMSFK